MPIDIQKLTSSTFGVNLAATIGRLLPLRLGRRFADSMAVWIAGQRHSPIIRAVRANQWVVRGECLDKEALDQAVRETLRYLARSIFDLYYYIDRPEAAKRVIVLDPFLEQLVHRPEFDRQGLIIIGLHLSNFDLILQWMSKQGLKPLALTIPDPQRGHRIEYQIRKKTGMNLVPASVGALRQTVKHLQRGGLVVTGVDRPVPDPVIRPIFFGRPAALPVHHIFLAAKAQVPMRLVINNLQADGKYHVLASEPIELERHPDHEVETLRNAEKVLNIAEKFIQQAPHQWSVSLPVWPETLSLVPN
jgi:phosphatidylinositol dimannoside acyltransferase